jgi:AraC family transcriptional regulator
MNAAEAYTPKRNHDEAIERVIRIMHESLDRRIKLEDLGRAAYISPFHFNRIFHSVVGIPPVHFLSALRIHEAKRLLIRTQRKVIDICYDVGFTSPGTFSRRFRDYVGLAPNHLRSLASRLVSGNHSQRWSPPCLRSYNGELGLCGDVFAPEGFTGPVFLGLFSSPLPQSRPLGCCILAGPGSYQMSRLPDGLYYLLSVGLLQTHDPRDLLLCEPSLRGGSTTTPVRIYNGKVQSSMDVVLRPAEVTDPPILLTLPWLIAQLPDLESESDSLADPAALSKTQSLANFS